MRGQVSLPLAVGGFVLGFIILVGAGEYHRRAKLAEADEQSQVSSLDRSGKPPDFSPSYLPPEEITLSLSAGDVKPAGGMHNGPRSLRIRVDAKQRITFGLVPKSQESNYRSPRNMEAVVEKIPCSSSGTSGIVVTCDLADGDKDMVLLVADMRDSYKASRDLFDASDDKKKAGLPADYFNNVSISVTITKFGPSAP